MDKHTAHDSLLFHAERNNKAFREGQEPRNEQSAGMQIALSIPPRLSPASQALQLGMPVSFVAKVLLCPNTKQRLGNDTAVSLYCYRCLPADPCEITAPRSCEVHMLQVLPNPHRWWLPTQKSSHAHLNTAKILFQIRSEKRNPRFYKAQILTKSRCFS